MKKLIFFAALVLTVCACGPKSSAPQVGSMVRDTIADIPCCVYTPHNYTAQAEWPVLYLQHGMYGNENDWVEQGFLLHWMDSLLQIGEVKDMVIVMPDNCPSRPTAEEEKANATSGFWEQHFAQFMAETESKYRVSNDPSQRAIAGLSMGGYHTMRVACELDGQFAYVGMFSPATFVHQAPTNPELFYIAIGNEDFLYESLMAYRKWLDENHVEYTYYESTGGHTWPNWQDYICRFLPKLFK